MNSVFLAKSNKNKRELRKKRSESINTTNTLWVKTFFCFVIAHREKEAGFRKKHTAADDSLCKDKNGSLFAYLQTPTTALVTFSASPQV